MEQPRSKKHGSTGQTESSVVRILHHVERLTAFHSLDWILQEKNDEAVLKLEFTQDQTFTNSINPETQKILPRIVQHIDRLSKSHSLREWDLRETDGMATIVVTFTYEDAPSPEDVFFMTSSNLKSTEDPEETRVVDSRSIHSSNICDGRKYIGSSVKKGVQNENQDQTPLKINIKCRSVSPVALFSNKRNTESSKDATPKVFEKQSIKSAVSTSKKTVNESSKVSEGMKLPVKSKIKYLLSERGSSSERDKHSVSQNPFSVKNMVGDSSASGRLRKPLSQKTTGKTGIFQKSKSTSSLQKGLIVTSTTSSKDTKDSSKAKPPFESKRFTFRKMYNKGRSTLKEKSETCNSSLKRKTEHLDNEPENLQRIDEKASAPKGQRHNHKDSVQSSKTPIRGPRHSVSVDINVPCPDTKSPIGDMYRLYFADNTDTSMCSVGQHQEPSQSSESPQPKNPLQQFSSTPANKESDTMTLAAFSDLFKKHFPDSAKRCDISKIVRESTGPGQEVRPDRTDSNAGSVSSGFCGSQQSDTESNADDKEDTHEATLTEASNTSATSEAFSCCTEPCLNETAKSEIQDYYLEIYKQIQREAKVETDQLVWEINDTGRISLYHKALKQTKVHDLITPEELLKMDHKDGVIPRYILKQYIFRRLLEELDQVTFDNRALTGKEKQRLDRFMEKSGKWA